MVLRLTVMRIGLELRVGTNFPAAELRDGAAIRLSRREPGLEEWCGQVGGDHHLINAIAKARGVDLYELPVGFKYIGELIMQDKIAIGGEESAGLSIRHHGPEKDGVLAGLLCCEMLAKRGSRWASN